MSPPVDSGQPAAGAANGKVHSGGVEDDDASDSMLSTVKV
jgi:hypothetical protein